MKKLLTIATLALLSTSASFAASDMKSDNKTNKSYSQADHDKWWHDRDTNNDGKISRQEYVNNETKDGKSAAEARSEFDKKDTDKDGALNASEFKAWFEKVGDKVQGTTHKTADKARDTKEDLKNDRDPRVNSKDSFVPNSTDANTTTNRTDRTNTSDSSQPVIQQTGK